VARVPTRLRHLAKHIRAVFVRGRYLDCAALDGLLANAERAATAPRSARRWPNEDEVRGGPTWALW